MNALPTDELERSVTSYNPLLAGRLRPGLTNARVRQVLGRAKVTGCVDLLVSLYTWKNGTVLDHQLASSKVGFFPTHAYYFIELRFALSHLKSFKEVANGFPKFAEAVERYLPLFWDGSSRWIAIDLQSSGAVVNINMRADRPFRRSYDALQDFFWDMIRANEMGSPPACLRDEPTE